MCGAVRRNGRSAGGGACIKVKNALKVSRRAAGPQKRPLLIGRTVLFGTERNLHPTIYKTQITETDSR